MVIDDPMGLQSSASLAEQSITEEVKVNLDKELPKVARTLAEFQNMLMRARIDGSKEIEASVDIHKYFQKEKYKPGVGYMYVQDVKVYEEGCKEKADANDRLTAKEVSFGKSKVVIGPMGMGNNIE